MQALCHWEVHSEQTPEALGDFIESRDKPTSTAKYAAEMVRAFLGDRQRVDELISDAAQNWDLPRMSPVERNVLRVAVVELSTDKVPPKVAINEAIEIGREYGGKESPRFVNGVLDAVMKRLAGLPGETD